MRSELKTFKPFALSIKDYKPDVHVLYQLSSLTTHSCTIYVVLFFAPVAKWAVNIHINVTIFSQNH